jgi:hypothetical protein
LLDSDEAMPLPAGWLLPEILQERKHLYLGTEGILSDRRSVHGTCVCMCPFLWVHVPIPVGAYWPLCECASGHACCMGMYICVQNVLMCSNVDLGIHSSEQEGALNF